jgi:hypothetical protein
MAMWSERIALVIVALGSLTACGTTQFQVQGAKFDLNSQEATLAEQYTREDPVQASPESRCQYWSQRAGAAGSTAKDHPAARWSDLSTAPGSGGFANLSAWTQAKQIEACSKHPRHEQQADGVAATTDIDGGNIVASFTSKMKCRETMVDVRDHAFQEQPEWTSCSSLPLSGASVRLILSDGQAVPATTDAKGRAHFDASAVPWTDDAFKSGQGRLAVGTDPAVGSFSLIGLPQYKVWQEKRAAESVLARDTKALDDIESALTSQLEVVAALEHAKEPWGDAQLAQIRRFQDAATERLRAEQILLGDKNVADLSLKPRNDAVAVRAGALEKRVNAIQPRVDHALAKAQARADQEALKAGRQFVLGKLRSPGSVQWISDTVLLRCPGGYVTAHEYDAQNGFGALIRNDTWVWLDVRNNRVYDITGHAGTPSCHELEMD